MMIIKNKKELLITKERENLLDILEKGVEAVLPEKVLKESVFFDKKNKTLKVKDTTFDLFSKRIFVIGGGKGAYLMAKAIEEIFGGENIEAGIVNCNFDGQKTKKIKINKASHPIPDENGMKGVLSMMALKKQYNIGPQDIIIFLISGGASSLIPLPAKEISLEDKRRVNSLLLFSGADIKEINTVRKHLSLVKGGRLGLFFAPAKVISLIISDVIGDDIENIGSGPTVKDSSTFKDAIFVLKKYNLFERVPRSVKDFLEKGARGEIEETPKELENCYNFILVNNKVSLETMAKEGIKRKLKPLILKENLRGDPQSSAFDLAKNIKEGKYKGFNLILFGGENTPKIPEASGKGGRIQHFLASFLLGMKDYKKKWCLAGLATDGTDFIYQIGGAVIDDISAKIVKEKNIKIEKYLENYDSYNFFLRVENSLIKTVDTGTNVGDIFAGYFR